VEIDWTRRVKREDPEYDYDAIVDGFHCHIGGAVYITWNVWATVDGMRVGLFPKNPKVTSVDEAKSQVEDAIVVLRRIDAKPY
jgi:hypothetical protein